MWNLNLQMDMKLDFLNKDLKKEVYVEQPPSFHKSKSKRMVYKLKKACMILSKLPYRLYIEWGDLCFLQAPKFLVLFYES